MKKTFLRTLIVIAVLAAFALTLTGCLLPMGPSPSTGADDSEHTVAYADRKLKFVPNVQNAQVNLDTVLGYFCYEDNQLRILTTESVTDTSDDSVTFAIKVFDDENGREATEDEFSYTIGSNGYVYFKSSVIGHAELNAVCANGSSIETVKIGVAGRGIALWDILIAGIAVYLLYSAIAGKGRLYENEFIKEGMEDVFKKIVRIAAAVIGVLMLGNVAVSAFDRYGKFAVVKYVLFGAMLVAFLAAMLLLRKCIDQKARREATEARYSGMPRKAPSAAFEFDENEPTVDDIVNAEDDGK